MNNSPGNRNHLRPSRPKEQSKVQLLLTAFALIAVIVVLALPRSQEMGQHRATSSGSQGKLTVQNLPIPRKGISTPHPVTKEPLPTVKSDYYQALLRGKEEQILKVGSQYTNDPGADAVMSIAYLRKSIDLENKHDPKARETRQKGENVLRQAEALLGSAKTGRQAALTFTARGYYQRTLYILQRDAIHPDTANAPKPDEVLATYEEAIRADPTLEYSYLLKIKFHLERDEEQNAIDTYNQATTQMQGSRFCAIPEFCALLKKQKKTYADFARKIGLTCP